MDIVCPVCFTDIGKNQKKCPKCSECLDDDCEDRNDCGNNHTEDEEE